MWKRNLADFEEILFEKNPNFPSVKSCILCTASALKGAMAQEKSDEPGNGLEYVFDIHLSSYDVFGSLWN